MCRGSPREQSPQHPRSTAPGDHMIGGPDGAMLLVPIISRGLEMSADAALVVGEHERRLDGVAEGAPLIVVVHPLEHGEDPLAGGGVGRECKDDACAQAPRGEVRAVGCAQPGHTVSAVLLLRRGVRIARRAVASWQWSPDVRSDCDISCHYCGIQGYTSLTDTDLL